MNLRSRVRESFGWGGEERDNEGCKREAYEYSVRIEECSIVSCTYNESNKFRAYARGVTGYGGSLNDWLSIKFPFLGLLSHRSPANGALNTLTNWQRQLARIRSRKPSRNFIASRVTAVPRCLVRRVEKK